MPYPTGHRAEVKKNIIDTAQSIAALATGGMVVARTMVDRARADELRADCVTVALNLGGWDKKSKSKNGKSKCSRPEVGLDISNVDGIRTNVNRAAGQRAPLSGLRRTLLLIFRHCHHEFFGAALYFAFGQRFSYGS